MNSKNISLVSIPPTNKNVSLSLPNLQEVKPTHWNNMKMDFKTCVLLYHIELYES